MNGFTYYLAANTGKGYISLFDGVLNSFKKIIILKNITKDTKKRLFDEVKAQALKKEVLFDTVMRCATHDEIDAIIFPELSCVIADINLIVSDYPLYADVIDFAFVSELEFPVQKDISAINKQILFSKNRMYQHLTEAKKIHDEWEKIYISNLDFDAINKSGDELLCSLFNNVSSENENKKYKNINRFFGTMLPRGTINYIDELTESINKRIFIKGRPGTGKSTLMKKIIAAANENGFDTETYYCSLDPNSIDMVVIRNLDVCVFDSTPPHEKFPEKDGDIIFDVYDIAAVNDPDTLYVDELMHIESRYNSEIKKAKECLYTASALRQNLDHLLTKDEEHTAKLINKVLSMSSLVIWIFKNGIVKKLQSR